MFLIEQKIINVKVSNMITKRKEAKTLIKYISMVSNSNFIVQQVIQIKSGIMKHVNVNVKTIVRAKKFIVGIQANIFVKMVKTYF